MLKVANDSILDLQKVVEVHMKFLNQINHKKVLREMEEREEKILWN